MVARRAAQCGRMSLFVVLRSGCVVQRRTVIGSRAAVDSGLTTATVGVTSAGRGHRTVLERRVTVCVLQQAVVEEQRLVVGHAPWPFEMYVVWWCLCALLPARRRHWPQTSRRRRSFYAPLDDRDATRLSCNQARPHVRAITSPAAPAAPAAPAIAPLRAPSHRRHGQTRAPRALQ